MNKLYYDMIYLISCGANNKMPEQEFLKKLELEKIFHMSCAHSLETFIGMTLKNAGIVLSKEWNERILKSIRKVMLFDAERTKLLAFMEANAIWYLPLKGIILKDYYPAIGMRQMADNDILFDADFGDKVKIYMESQGYKSVSVGIGTHDVYKKEPVYNFELHRSLYAPYEWNNWEAYYKDIKIKLIQNSENSYGYHFTDEDFYVYIVLHAYKHYVGSGTGLRTLVDFYIYLKAKEQELDFSYIERECETLGVKEFEIKSRCLCKKIFEMNSLKSVEVFDELLLEEEKELLFYYLTSGVYGTFERGIKNGLKRFEKKTGSKSKMLYLLKRIFPGIEAFRRYPLIYKHKWLLPVGWTIRIIKMIINKNSREHAINEAKVVKKL